MKASITFLLSITLFFGACQQSPQQSGTDQKIDSLLSLMTVEEKVGQLNLYNGTWEFTGPVPDNDNAQEKAEKIKTGQVGAMLNVLTAEGTRSAQKMAVENSRLGIPLLFGYDVIHGFKTMMPIPLAQAASWDPEVARRGAEVAASEASASGINWTFAPMVDISRDARWGRMMESPGEDPYLASVMSEAWVKGFQGEDLAAVNTIAACAKHFAAYGFAEAGRDYNDAEISESTLYNVVLPPFKAANEANVASFMNSFNLLNGVPANGSELLQRQILKGAWDFSGFVVSDWGSIVEMIAHGYSADTTQAALHAITAGSDMDMEGKVYETSLAELVETGKVSTQILDDAVRRVLGIKFKLGLFDDPYRYCDVDREKSELLTEANLAVARDAARKSIVLLKNEDQVLPLKKEGQKIVVIGSLAAEKDVPIGSWRAQGETNSAVSLLEGVKNAVANPSTMNFTNGYQLTEGLRAFQQELTFVNGDKSGFKSAIALAKKSDVVVLALGEDCWQTGEGRSQTDIGLKGDQLDLFNELVKVNKNIVVALMSGRSLAIPEVADKAKAVLAVWHLGSEAGNGIADVLFGDYNPSGKLPVSFPYHVGQCPLYYNRMNTGRGTPANGGMVFWSHYTDAPNEALYPFGHGLSYASFEYSQPVVSKSELTSSESITLSVTVKNTSEVAGTETVQFYLRDYAASWARPVKELKAYEQITLAPGEEKEVTFEITNETLSYTRPDLTFGSEPGRFALMVGGSSRDVQSVHVELK